MITAIAEIPQSCTGRRPSYPESIRFTPSSPGSPGAKKQSAFMRTHAGSAPETAGTRSWQRKVSSYADIE
jgi:hypothetical protein